MRIHQSYLLEGGRKGTCEEDSNMDVLYKSAAERLQLVHYGVGDQYMPHHDFSIPSSEDGQPMRFATLLLYLNDDMKGGEISFPRWLHTGEQEGDGHLSASAELGVSPEAGKAVLFYSTRFFPMATWMSVLYMLPSLSQKATSGWLIFGYGILLCGNSRDDSSTFQYHR
jgi:hypothetical protein